MSLSFRSTAVAAGVALSVAIGGGALPASAAKSKNAPRTIKKAMWGPAFRNGKSQFPIYRRLGVGIWETSVQWSEIAPARPTNPADPNDPAYHWPAELDRAVREAQRYKIRVAVTIMYAPKWANGGKPFNWAPNDPADFATFATAAAKRWPSVHLWQVWGEPSRQRNFMPLQPEHRGSPLTAAQAEGPHVYAQILDASYAALKRASRKNLIIGGNTFTTGDISPRSFIRNLRLPDGKPPRMDLYGHNPFTGRSPNLSKPPLPGGLADFSDLDTLARWIDSNLARPGQKKIKLFLSEFTLPTDHPNHDFNFYVSRRTQAAWLKRALTIARHWSRIYTLGWLALYDEAPRRSHDETDFGLMDQQGRRKPAYYVYQRG